MKLNWADVAIAPAKPQKVDVHMRLDRDIVDHFRTGGPGYQGRVNAVLRSYVAHSRGQPLPPETPLSAGERLKAAAEEIAAVVAELQAGIPRR